MKNEQKKGLLARMIDLMTGRRRLMALRRRRHRRLLRLLATGAGAARPIRRLPARVVHRIANRRPGSRHFQVVGPPMRSW